MIWLAIASLAGMAVFLECAWRAPVLSSPKAKPQERDNGRD